MERCFAKPVLEAGTICIYRQQGSITGRLVRIGPWRGGSVGMVAGGGGALVYHRLLPTEPVVGGLAGVSDIHLTPVGSNNPYRIAAYFLAQLAGDMALMANSSLWCHRLSMLESTSGQVFTEVRVPPGLRGRWTVLVQGRQAVCVESDDHAAALGHLSCELAAIASAGVAGKGAA